MIQCDIHITVKHFLKQMIFFCGDTFKLDIIELGNSDNHHFTYNLKKSFHTYNDILEFQKKVFECEEFMTILRFKVEVSPSSLNFIPVPPIYVEHHIKLGIDDYYPELSFLKDYVVSTSGFKSSLVYYTRRFTDILLGIETLTSDFNSQKELLENLGNKLKLECAIIDTNPELDKGWL